MSGDKEACYTSDSKAARSRTFYGVTRHAHAVQEKRTFADTCLTLHDKDLTLRFCARKTS